MRLPPQAGKSAGHGWLGIPAAVVAFVANLRFLSSRQPGTPLRMLSLIAITAALRSRGIVLGPDRRQAVIEAMELGALLNDRFDGDAYDPEELRVRLTGFTRSEHRDVVRSYVKRLCRLERSRPDPADSSTAVRRYRENVNRVSLATLWALGCARTLGIAELEIERETDLRLLFQIVMQAQVIDDVLDVSEDRRRGLPSFATEGASLRETVSIYADGETLRFDRNFCLRVALRTITAGARLVVAIAGRAV
jgi:hypothetical protein